MIAKHNPWTIVTLLLTAILLNGPAIASSKHDDRNDAKRTAEVNRLLPDIIPPNIVYVGEAHSDWGYHLNQLAVIKALVSRGLKVAVGFEMIQQPFQKVLDAYREDRIDFSQLLEKTEYFDRWRYDPRLYQPVFSYARQHGLPLVALNASKELAARVSEVGIDGLDDHERSELPKKINPPSPAYRELLEAVFREHAGNDVSDLETFIDVQRTWDEVMGATASEFLSSHPDHIMVVLAGIQHVADGFGIPSRVKSDMGLDGVIVLSERERSAHHADVFLNIEDSELPSPGRMGVLIDPSSDGVIISGFATNSPAEKAGARTNDRIVRINEREIYSYADIRLALWNKNPGDPVVVDIVRDNDKTDDGGDVRQQLWFELN